MRSAMTRMVGSALAVVDIAHSLSYRRPLPAFPLTRTGALPIMDPMTSPAFDTLKAAKALQAAGFDDAQAEAVIATVGDAVGGSLATKADLQELEATTKTELQALKATTKAELQALGLRITHKFESLYKHLWAMSAGIVTAVVALTKLLS